MIPMPNLQSHSQPNAGGRLVTVDGRTLPLRGAALRVECKGGLGRVVLQQRFENVYDEPLHVTYLMPLPADGAVSGYAFVLGDRRITGEVDRKQRARQRFEQALAEGRSAGIVEQERSSLFTQELGNIPPHSEVTAEIIVDQKLQWLAEGAWEWRFPTAIGARYQGAAGRVADASKLEVAVAKDGLPVRLKLALTIGDAIATGGRVSSPDHALHLLTTARGTEVELTDESGARLDRDVVVRWPVARRQPGVSFACGRPSEHRQTSTSAFALLSLVPPEAGAQTAVARDLILLFDTSGSMGGRPLEQSRKVALALLDSLGPSDRLEMIEFSTTARRWQKQAVHADEKQKRAARDWLKRLNAAGGTEMVTGVLEALQPIGAESQRQVVLLTDGYIGFETEVVRAVCDKLPGSSRLHVVGVGSSVNRSLTQPVARAGRGLELVIGIDEDPSAAAARIVKATAQPIVTNLAIEGAALQEQAPSRLPDLYAGMPALCALRIDPAGGELRLRGRTADGEWHSSIRIEPVAAGQGPQAAAALFARERVEDLELERAAGGDATAIDARIETLGLHHQIATRLTTWVAISEAITVDVTAPTRREEIPQELPHGVSAEGLGLRAVAPSPQSTLTGGVAFESVAAAPMAMAPPAPMPSMAAAPGRARGEGGAGAGAGGPPPSVGAPKKGMSVLRRAVDSLKEKIADVMAPSEPSPADAPAKTDVASEVADDQDEASAPVEAKRERETSIGQTRTGSFPSRRLRGKLRVLAGGEAVIEVEIDTEIEWTLPTMTVVKMLDRMLGQAVVLIERSTRDGKLTAGQTARLVLRIDQVPAEVWLPFAIIEVEAA